MELELYVTLTGVFAASSLTCSWQSNFSRLQVHELQGHSSTIGRALCTSGSDDFSTFANLAGPSSPLSNERISWQPLIATSLVSVTGYLTGQLVSCEVRLPDKWIWQIHGFETFHINPRFHPTGVGWSLWLIWKLPTLGDSLNWKRLGWTSSFGMYLTGISDKHMISLNQWSSVNLQNAGGKKITKTTVISRL